MADKKFLDLDGLSHFWDTIKTKINAKYTKPSGGIPKSDLASGVQTSLNKADSALQSYTETDPVFVASPAHGITATNITNWNKAEQNVQSDWNVTDTSSDAYIKNKPTIPPGVVVDSALSTISTNPVQNKVITSELNNKINSGDVEQASEVTLASVAISGSYNDLSDKPTITEVTEFTEAELTSIWDEVMG